MVVDPKQFWEAKLLDWEQGRYSRGTRTGILEAIANLSSRSLRFRISITPRLLQPYLAGRRVVELGCGSGLLAGTFVEYGAASYLGIDVAESAIGRARNRYGEHDPRIRFEVGSVACISPIPADLVISLGLFDWLTDEEIAAVFRKAAGADFLHAIAEWRPGIQQSLHRAYVQCAYGYRTGNYRPRYLACDHIRKLANAAVERPCYVYRNRQLSFGGLVSSLPIGDAL